MAVACRAGRYVESVESSREEMWLKKVARAWRKRGIRRDFGMPMKGGSCRISGG